MKNAEKKNNRKTDHQKQKRKLAKIVHKTRQQELS